LLALDADVLDRKLEMFASLGAELDLDVAYAGKALLVGALAKRLIGTSLSLDVCSLGELVVAERAGFPAARIVMHGCGKSDEELSAAVAGRVGRLVIDHRTELERLVELASQARPLEVFLRVNSGIEAHTHAYVRTGGEDSKFGFALGDVVAASARVAQARGLRLGGLHSHLGSQLFDEQPYRASLLAMLEVYAEARAGATSLGEVIVGGGFGVDSRPGSPQSDPRAIVTSLAALNRERSSELGMPPPRLGIEPGRAIVAEAGTSLYRVLAVKDQGSRRFVIIDGGLGDNPRPALYGAYHHPRLAAGRSSAERQTTVCGRSCENDELVTAPLPSDIAAGDVLAFLTTGAYTFSMASNYNRFPRPALVFAGGGSHRAVVRRESNEDLMRTDLDA